MMASVTGFSIVHRVTGRCTHAQIVDPDTSIQGPTNRPFISLTNGIILMAQSRKWNLPA